MTRVRFLRVKRYPHPDGPKRHPGDEVEMDAGLAAQWERAGLLERAKPKPESKPKAKATNKEK